jgi:hypothetical protein
MSERLIPNSAKLLPHPSQHKVLPGLSTVYQFSSELDDKRNLGELFIVIEVMADFKLCSQLINFIINTANESYFEQDNIIDPAKKLENTLMKINQLAKELSKKGSMAWIKKVNAIVAVVAQNQLHISRCNKADACLMRNGKLSGIFGSKINNHNQKEVFSEIISGELLLNDKLLFASPTIFFELSDDKLKSIMQSGPGTVVSDIKSKINANSLQRSAAIAIEMITEKILSEKVIERQKLRHDHKQQTDLESPEKSDKEAQKPLGKKRSNVKASSAARYCVESLKNGWNFLLKKIIAKHPKVSVSIGLILLALLSIWIFIAIFSAQEMSKLGKFKQAIDLTKQAQEYLDKNDKTQAYVISQKASNLLNEMTKEQKEANKINSLIAKSSIKDQFSSISSLQTRVRDIIDKSTGTVRADTTNAVDFSTADGSKPTMINLVSKNLILFDKDKNSIYQIDTAQPQIKTVISDTKDHTDLTAISYDNKSVYAMGLSELMQYLPTNETVIKQKTADGKWQKAVDIYSYLSNLYLLSPDNKQIYRYAKGSNGFGPKSNYLKTSDDSIKDAVSFAINGNIYVVLKNGQVLMYKSGVKESFAIENLAPNIDGINKLVFDQTKSNLFAISEDKQSIIKLNLSDNKASFEKQYRSDEFKTIDSISVDSDSKTIYVLSEKKVYKFNYE